MEKLHQNIAKLVTAAMMANGTVDKGELEIAKDLASDLEIKWEDFKAEIENAQKEIDALKDDDFDKYVEKIASQIPDDEKGFVFEAVTHVMLADNSFDSDELIVLSTIADTLQLSSDEIISTIAFIVNNKDGLKVNFE